MNTFGRQAPKSYSPGTNAALISSPPVPSARSAFAFPPRIRLLTRLRNSAAETARPTPDLLASAASPPELSSNPPALPGPRRAEPIRGGHLRRNTQIDAHCVERLWFSRTQLDTPIIETVGSDFFVIGAGELFGVLSRVSINEWSHRISGGSSADAPRRGCCHRLPWDHPKKNARDETT